MAKENLASRRIKVKDLIRERHLEDANEMCAALCRDYPDDPESWFLLGSLAGQAGDLSRATDCFHKAIELDPRHAGAYVNLGRALDRSEKYEEGEPILRRAQQLRPQDPSICFLLGRALHMQNKHDEAIAMYLQTVSLDPNHFNAHYNLGQIYQSRGNFVRAEQSYRGALKGNPGFADAWAGLGHNLAYQEKFVEAEAALTKALALGPESAQICYDLGFLRHSQQKFTEAKTYYKKALTQEPNNSAVLSDLGRLYKDSAQIDEAISKYQRAIAIDPAWFLPHNNLCFTLNYKSGIDANSLYLAHLDAASVYNHPAEEIHFANKLDPAKRIKVGYVSGDFRMHPVAFFIDALFEYHDHGNVEVAGYSNVILGDETMERFKSLVDRWVPVAGVSDEEVVKRIRDDGVDILVDLSGYTGNRLGVFACRAAPVQVTYLGYPNTTGLKEMDYRLTDKWADPEDLHPDQYYTEELVRLPRSFACYTPPREAPDVSPLPALSKGHVTYASLNNLPKINDRVIAVWSKIMTQVEGSRLILQAAAFSDEGVRSRIKKSFGSHGIEAGRLELQTRCPLREHLALYNRIDIALDPFPWNGHTTTCHALWMGVPVVALAGDRHASRMSLSVLSNVSLQDWIAWDETAYVEIAVKWARQLNELQVLRSTMRDRMLPSGLCDGAVFTRDVEQVYRRMWERWCAQQHSD